MASGQGPCGHTSGRSRGDRVASAAELPPRPRPIDDLCRYRERRGEQASLNKAGPADACLRIFSINTQRMQAHGAVLESAPRTGSGCGLLEGWRFSSAPAQKLFDICPYRLYYDNNTRFKKREDLGRRDARMSTREEHLVRCKQEAIARLETGDLSGAIASMISDLRKSGDPLYDATVLRELLVEALVHRTTPDEVRAWIDSFN